MLIILLSFQALFIVLLHQWLPVLLSFQALFIAMLSFQALIISDGFALQELFIVVISFQVLLIVDCLSSSIIIGTMYSCDLFPGTN